MADLVACIGCGAMVEDLSGKPHPYLGASAGCWQLYGRLLAREYEDYEALRDTHLYTVDAYSLQHPGVPERRSIQSVSLHLVRLYLALERGFRVPEVMVATRRVLRERSKFVWLTPPSPNGTVTVADALAANGVEEHKKAVVTWAENVWAAWAPHHAYAAALAARCR